MSDILKVNTTLRELDLGGEERKEEMFRERKRKKERMTDNKIGAEGATALSEMLKVNTALTEIYLRCEYEKEEKKKI